MSTCPSHDDFKDYVLGILSTDRAEVIEAHLDTCESCQTTLDEVASESDELVHAMRHSQADATIELDSGWRQAEALVKAIGQEWSQAAQPALTTTMPIRQLREYELLEELGHGGMGTVYKALHTKLQKVVALKVLPNDRMENADAVRRFEREMQAVGRLDHPHIVRATDAGEVDGTHFLVMEYVEGLDLSQLVTRLGPLPVPEACEIVRQAALGLQHAHEHGMVHRDIKPSNLMLTSGRKARGAVHDMESTVPLARSPQTPAVKILDLGLALLNDAPAAGGELTSTNQIMGTLDYMAPEQAADTHAVDIRADLYSLGATLYKLLSGKAPCAVQASRSPAARLNAVLNTVPVPISERRPELSEALSELVGRLLEKEPDARPATPAELVMALLPFTEGADLNRLTDQSSDRTLPTVTESSVNVSSRLIETDVDVVRQPGGTPRSEADGRGDEEHHADAPTAGLQSTSGRSSVAGVARSGDRDKAGTSTKRALFGIGAVILLGVIVFKFATRDGTVYVELETEQPVQRIEVDGHEVEWSLAGSPTRFKFDVDPGERTVRIFLEDGTEVITEATEQPIEIAAGGEQTIRAWLEEPRPQGSGFNAPPANFALKFDGDDAVTIQSLVNDGDVPLTVEAWTRPTPPPTLNGYVIDGAAGMFVQRHTNGKLTWLPYIREEFRDQPLQWHRPQSVPYEHVVDQWVHVAVCYSEDMILLFIDGELAADMPGGLMPLQGVPEQLRSFRIGSGRGAPPDTYFFGLIEEVRISSVARYTEDFTPDERFEPDEHTLALYHFDEGEGEMLVDSSGNEHHGTIHGARWVRVLDYEIDGAVAEWVLSVGGTVRIVSDGNVQSVDDRNMLPAGEFSVQAVLLRGIKQVTDADLPMLAGLDQLVELDLSQTGVTDAGLAEIGRISNLETLFLAYRPITDVGIASLSRLSQLKHLNIGFTAVTDRGLALIVEQFPDLEILYVGSSGITADGLSRELSWLPRLQYISIDATQWNRGVAAALAGRTDFADLVIQGPVTVEQLSLIESLPIRALWLYWSDLTEEHLKSVTQLSQLETLVLVGNTLLSDAAVARLGTMPNLKGLNLDSFPVTAEQLAQLREALPNCQIGHAPYDADRAVAEWVQSIGGSGQVKVDGRVIGLSPDEPLPAENFTVRSVLLTGNQQVTNEDLQRMAGLSELRQLRLIETGIGDEGLQYVSQCRSLEMLYLGATDVSNAGLSLLRDLPLSSLTVDRIRLTQEGLDNVSQIVTLESLNIAQQKLASLDLRVLLALPRLTHLGVHNSDLGDEDVVELAQLTNLTSIHVGKTGLTADGLARLQEALPDCRIVHESIPGSNDRAVAEWVLERGGMAAIWLPSGEVQYLHSGDEIPVSEFQIGGIDLFEIPPDVNTPISNLDRLWNLAWTHASVDDAAILQLSNLPSLQRVALQYSEVNDVAIEHLARFATLESLVIGSPHVTDAAIAYLLQLPKLRELDLECRQLTNAGLETIGRIEQLEILTIDNMPQITDEGLAHLVNLQHLSELTIESYMDVTWEGIGQLSALPALETLTIQGARPGEMSVLGQFNGLTTLGLRRMEFEAPEQLQLPPLPHLERLDLTRSQITDAALSQVVEQYPELQLLDLDYTPVTDVCVPTLSRLEGLRELTLTGTEITVDGLDRLREALPDCQIIHESTGATIDDHRAVVEWVFAHGGTVALADPNDFRWESGRLSTLAELPDDRDWRIHSIDLQGVTEVGDAAMAELANLIRGIRVFYFNLSRTNVSDATIAAFQNAEIVKLQLDGTRVTDEGMAGLAAIRSLGHVTLNGTSITDVGIRTIAQLDGLEILFLSNTGITDECLTDLARLTDLDQLNLNNTAVSDEGLQLLRQHRRLSTLYLANTQITDAGLAHLVDLPDLRVLAVTGTAITDEGMPAFAAMEGLESLGLSHTEITDTGLAQLHGLSRLTSLSVANTNVTEDGVRSLQEALPDCEIIWDVDEEKTRIR